MKRRKPNIKRKSKRIKNSYGPDKPIEWKNFFIENLDVNHLIFYLIRDLNEEYYINYDYFLDYEKLNDGSFKIMEINRIGKRKILNEIIIALNLNDIKINRPVRNSPVSIYIKIGNKFILENTSRNRIVALRNNLLTILINYFGISY